MNKKISFWFLCVCFIAVSKSSCAQSPVWTDKSPGWSEPIEGLYAFDVNNIIIAGGTGKIAKTTDGGTTWTYAECPYCTSVPCTGASFFCGAGCNAGCTKCTSGLCVTKANIYYGLSCPDASTCYVTGYSDDIGKTTTAGNSNSGIWAQKNTGVAGKIQRGIWFTSSTTGFSVGSDGGCGIIYKTTDGGTTWTNTTGLACNVACGVGCWLQAVHFPTAATGYAVGMGGSIQKTTDGGATWTNLSGNYGGIANLYGVWFKDASTGIAVGGSGSSGVILKTTDGGTTWSSKTINATCSNGPLEAIHNFGTTWVTVGRNIDASSGSVTVALRSTDDGNTWYDDLQGCTGPTTSLYEVKCIDATTYYVAGASGKVWKRTAASSTNTGCSGSCILPVDMLSFTGQCSEKNVTLNWATASEQNNDYFTIEKSSNANDWKTAGTIKGAGNSSTVKQYEFTDPIPNREEWGGALYYRLKQTDYNGQYKYYGSVSVDCKAADGFFIYPTVSNGSYFITSNLENAEVTIYSMIGKKMYSSIINSKSLTINLDAPNGIYFLQLKTENGITNKKIIINK